jgi:hypothetical protein
MRYPPPDPMDASMAAAGPIADGPPAPGSRSRSDIVGTGALPLDTRPNPGGGGPAGSAGGGAARSCSY